MARTDTLLEIRTRVRRRAGLETETGRFPDAEVTIDVNESIAALRDMLIRFWGSDRFETEQSINVTSGTSAYALAAGCYVVLAVELHEAGTGRKTFLEHVQRREKPEMNSSDVQQAGMPFGYRLIGDNVEIFPPPAAAYTMKVRYLAGATRLSADGDTFDGYNGWTEWVVVDAARKLATKDRDFSLVQILTADLAKLEERIRAMAPMRDRTAARRIVDVRGGRAGRRRIYS